MKKRLGILIMLFVFAFGAMLTTGEKVDAAKYKATAAKKIGGVYYYLKSVGSKNIGGQEIRFVVYNLKKDFKVGKKIKRKNIAKNVLSTMVTNGSDILFTKVKNKKNVIYRYNVRTGKKSVVLSGKRIVIYGYNGAYLYYGYYPKRYDNKSGYTAYSYNMKTRIKTKMRSNISYMECKNGHVFMRAAGEASENATIYVFNKSGSKGYSVGEGITFKAKKKKVLILMLEKGANTREKVISSSFNGKKQKVLVDWTTNPKKINKKFK